MSKVEWVNISLGEFKGFLKVQDHCKKTNNNKKIKNKNKTTYPISHHLPYVVFFFHFLNDGDEIHFAHKSHL